MKKITDTIKEVQYRRLLKRSFEPRAEFLESSREAFLAEVAKRRVAPYAPQFAWRSFGMRTMRYSIAFAGIALLGTSGLVAYADNRNVGIASPLYPLKRIGEQVRLAAVPAARETEVHRELAQRRASEFIEIETSKKPDDRRDVAELRKVEERENELRSEFRKNIEHIEDRVARQNDTVAPVVANSTGLCQAIEVVERRSGNGKSEAYKKFEERCKESLKKDDDNRAATINATSTPVRNDRSDDRQKESEERQSDKNPTADDSSRGDRQKESETQQPTEVRGTKESSSDDRQKESEERKSDKNPTADDSSRGDRSEDQPHTERD